MDLESIVPAEKEDISTKTRNYFLDLLTVSEGDISTKKQYETICRGLTKKHKVIPSKESLFKLYQQMPDRVSPTLKEYLIQKAVRSSSGILNVSVSLPPNEFSCKYNCYFCPNEPGMPRSYLSNEDVFKRAAQVNFITVDQVYSRLFALERNGHVIDKLEFRVLGGTFSSYDHRLADDFIRDLYYAANTYTTRFSAAKRAKGTIEEEQEINVTADVHVVGLGIETRPDSICHDEIIRFRKYGVTRVEIGVQHTDDALLRRVNRGHSVKHSRRAVKLLKDYGFKVEIHIMADLPGATPEGDKECYKEVLQGEDLIPDYLKDYPCLDVDFTVIKEWKKSGLWTPYSERTPDARDLVDVLIYRQAITPKWVRVNRVQRDFQSACDGRLGYSSVSIKSNLAQIVKDAAEKQGIFCKCIRCCELRNETFKEEEILYSQDWFIASGAQEVFIYAYIHRDNRHLLLGFLRLRLPSPELEQSVIEELQGKTAMIRELHVYGRMTAVGKQQENGTAMSAQHRGIGKSLLRSAEHIAFTMSSAEKISVISGIGVRGYYQKNGYELRGSYMMKDKVVLMVPASSAPVSKDVLLWMIKDCIWDILLILIMYMCVYLYVKIEKILWV